MVRAAKRNGPKKFFPVCAFFGLASTAGQRGPSQYLAALCVAVEASARRCGALCARLAVLAVSVSGAAVDALCGVLVGSGL